MKTGKKDGGKKSGKDSEKPHRTNPEKRKRKNHLSGIYHQAEKDSIKAGNSAELALKAARKASKEAGIVWDAKHAGGGQGGDELGEC